MPAETSLKAPAPIIPDDGVERMRETSKKNGGGEEGGGKRVQYARVALDGNASRFQGLPIALAHLPAPVRRMDRACGASPPSHRTVDAC